MKRAGDLLRAVYHIGGPPAIPNDIAFEYVVSIHLDIYNERFRRNGKEAAT